MFPRLCHVGRAEEAVLAKAALARAAALGFSGVIVTPEVSAWRRGALCALGEACASRGLDLLLDLDVAQWDMHDDIVRRHPDCFAIRHDSNGEAVDPRSLSQGRGRAFLRSCDDTEAVAAWLEGSIAGAIAAGVPGLSRGLPGWRRDPIVARSYWFHPGTCKSQTRIHCRHYRNAMGPACRAPRVWI